VRFSREKSLLLASLALLAPLPLPLNLVVGWLSIAAYVLVVGAFIVRTLNGRETLLPYWMMNLLGGLYLPFFLLDLTVLRRGSFLQPLVHLAMFALVVKLLAMRREKDKWHVLLTIFFVFVASAGTSVHPAVAAYLVVFLVVATATLVRFAGFHAIARSGNPSSLSRSSVASVVAIIVLFVIVAAVPLFFFMPRLRRPYVWSPAAGVGGGTDVAGFSNRMDLDVIGRVRSSRSVLLRYEYENSVAIPPESRFKAAVFDRYDGGAWRRTPRPTLSVSRGPDGLFHLAKERVGSWIAVWQRTAGDSRAVLPVLARVIEVPTNALVMEDSGTVHFLLPPPGTIEFRVGLGSGSRVAAPGPRIVGNAVPELDRSGVTAEIEALASEVMADGSPSERVDRVQQHLLLNYDYALDLSAAPTDDPVSRFLFETRTGQGEYFVSAMVLMLRSQGIPARVVTGYLGADYNRWQGYFIVRQSHAHAWVEAWIDGHGWQVFDPTPQAGRPAVEESGLSFVFGQAWDALLFRWDRYVLTYGFYDQVDAFMALRDVLQEIWMSVFPGGGERKAELEAPAAIERDSGEAPARSRAFAPSPFHGLLLLVPALVVAAWLWWRRERFSATTAYTVLRALLVRGGSEEAGPVDSIAPLEVGRRLADECPSMRREASLIVGLYLEESFGGRDLDAGEIGEVRQALRAARKKWKKSA
jgi:transglutaminase-like putative cysteine protease